MNALFEIFKVILPAIITGLFTFIITKYTYNKNTPLDKLEIAYNRVYYPISRIISCSDSDIYYTIEKIKIYFTKYDKYIDASTKTTFEQLCKCDKKHKQKFYLKFKDNIKNRNLYLRRRLGYLEPNFILTYKYADSYTRFFIRFFIEIFTMVMAAVFFVIFIKISDILLTIFLIIFMISLGLLLLDILCSTVVFTYQIIKEHREYLKNFH